MEGIPSVVLTLVATFLAALLLSLGLTPFVGRLARRRGLVDLPSRRKVHPSPVPRVGGVAIFFSVMTTCAGVVLLYALLGRPSMPGLQIAGLLGGGALVFGLGFLDDIRGLSPGLKFAVQLAVGLVAYFGGIGIHAIQLPGFPTIQLGLMSLPVTVLWFVLVINAINLIDGLDGLAAGITMFSSIVLLVLGMLHNGAFACVGLAALAGATLGFLRYNFNPATIFMGDGGSYFLGYMLAALSILGSLKTKASVTILLPIIALGLPLMEVIWSGIRRFLMGQGIFRADKDHLHHRLLRLGYTHRMAVLVLYGMALTLGILALLLVQASDRLAGMVLVALGVTMMVGIRKLGYIDYLTTDKLLGWARDLSDVMGVNGGWRTFLGIQVAVAESASREELWERLQAAAQHLRMDSVELSLNGAFGDACYHADFAAEGRPEAAGTYDALTTMCISMPVGDEEHRLGCLVLARRLDQAPPEFHVLRRMEHLRRSTSVALLRLAENRGIGSQAWHGLFGQPADRPVPASGPNGSPLFIAVREPGNRIEPVPPELCLGDHAEGPRDEVGTAP
jgi:UDP-GlcNAc:undecaprenyl-phosphate/decaprenyl-phosphate GlcNAc-1-phosphate transferase